MAMNHAILKNQVEVQGWPTRPHEGVMELKRIVDALPGLFDLEQAS